MYKIFLSIYINPLYYDYILILISAILICFIGLILIIISWIITPSMFDIEKLSIYECGFDPFETSRINVDINFFIIGLLFLIFDLELFFLIPFLTILFKWNFLNYYLIFYFLIVLLLGFIYEIKSYSLFYIKNNIKLKKLYKLFNNKKSNINSNNFFIKKNFLSLTFFFQQDFVNFISNFRIDIINNVETGLIVIACFPPLNELLGGITTLIFPTPEEMLNEIERLICFPPLNELLGGITLIFPKPEEMLNEIERLICFPLNEEFSISNILFSLDDYLKEKREYRKHLFGLLVPIFISYMWWVFWNPTVSLSDDEIKKLIEEKKIYVKSDSYPSRYFEEVKDGYDKDGYDKYGYNKDGYDKDGYYRDGYNKDGFNTDGYDKNGFNKNGFDKNGYDKNGFDRSGFDKDGYNKDGYNKDGYEKPLPTFEKFLKENNLN